MNFRFGPRRLARLALTFILLALAPGIARADAGVSIDAPDADLTAPDAGAPPSATTVDAPPPPSLPARLPAPPALAPEPAVAPTPPLVALAGQVLARGTREPLAGVTITIDGREATESGETGAFSARLTEGPHTLAFQFPGHEPHLTTVLVTRTLEPLLVRLTPSATAERYETVVRAPRPEAPVVPLDRRELSETPGALGDPFRVVESLPGVAAFLWPLPIFAVRGSNPGTTGFFLDEQRLPALFHFLLGPAVIHPHFIESIDFYPGGYPARYGRYVGGIVAANTASAPPDRLRGALDVRLYDAGLMLSSPINQGQGTVTAAGRYAYPGALLSLLEDEVSLHYWDYQLRLDHILGPGKLTLFAFGSYDSLETESGGFPGNEMISRDRLVLIFHRVDVRWRGQVAGGWLKAGLAAGFDRTELPIDNNLPIEVRARSLLPRLSFARPLGRTADLELGADADFTSYQRPLGAGGLEDADFLRPRTLLMTGVFASVTARLGARLVLTPGIRLDFFQEQIDSPSSMARAWGLGPRLAAQWQLGETSWLKAIGGRFSQMPHLPLQLPTFEGFGLTRHGLESSWQGSLGIEHKSPRGLDVEATTFVSRGVLSDIRDPDFGDPLLNDFLVPREALAYGAELMLRRPSQHRVHGWLSYTLSRSLRAFEGDVVGPSDFDQRHTLNLVVSARWGRNTIGGRLHFHTGRLVKIQDSMPLEMARLPAFHQIDLRVARRAVFDRFLLEGYLELVNATLRPQVTALRDTPRGIEQEQFQLVLPSLGLRAEF